MPENSAGTLHNQMKSIEPELNFTDEFTLSRNGIAKEIEADFDTIRLCLDLEGGIQINARFSIELLRCR